MAHAQAMKAITPPRPTGYDESLAARCFPQRWRRLGSPVEYLDSIGIVPVVEFIIKGHLRHDVAEVTNVPYTTLQEWIKANGYENVVEDAETLSAEGMLAEGARSLRQARCEFDLKKAKALLDHAQYMAAKKNRGVYGLAANAPPNSPITYVFNIGNSKQTMQAQDVIDVEAVPVPRTAEQTVGGKQTLDLGALFGVSQTVLDAPLEQEKNKRVSLITHALEHLSEVDKETVLVADRPATPTAAEPDIGPFFEGASNGAV